jgi:hypothetical protein
MPSALDLFREQRDAADHAHQRLTDVAALLVELRQQATALASDKELRAVLRLEQSWLAQARQMVAEVRALREAERHRFWPGVARRWAVTAVLAVASAAAAGAGYGMTTARQEATEVATLRSRVAVADAIERRIQAMTAAERRQLERLIGGPTGTPGSQ